MNPLSSKKIGENFSPTRKNERNMEVVLEDRVDSDHMEELSEMEASRVVGGVGVDASCSRVVGGVGVDASWRLTLKRGRSNPHRPDPHSTPDVELR
jgi:hypothetical protein